MRTVSHAQYSSYCVPAFDTAFVLAEGVELPETATVKLSANMNSTEEFAVDSSVNLSKLTLGPGQAVMLHFPYMG